jgi:hypothetical protein
MSYNLYTILDIQSRLERSAVTILRTSPIARNIGQIICYLTGRVLRDRSDDSIVRRVLTPLFLAMVTCSTPSAKPAEQPRELHAPTPVPDHLAPAEKRQDIMPSHTQITDAVTATGDRELASWVKSSDSYVTQPVAMTELDHHDIFRVMPVGVSRPMSFLIAVHRDGRTMVTTSNAHAVAELLAAEPRLAQSDELPERVYQLIRAESRRQRLLRGPEDVPRSLRSQNLSIVAPEVQRSDTGWLVRLSVLDNAGMLQLWTVKLPKKGQASFKRKNVATGLEVDLGP